MVTEELTFQCDPPFLLYKNSRGRKEGNRHGIFGIWFYNQVIGARGEEVIEDEWGTIS